MQLTKNEPNITKLFVKDNLAPQPVYKSNKKYKPVYINKELYERLFNEEYEERKAFKKISDIFSITLDKKKSNSKQIGTGYADKQEDPMGISLSGNEGSGRAYFYGECFNIKGDKTTLATSPKETYSNGKYPLPSAIKETIITNILNKELSIPTYETLAVLDTNEYYDFTCEYLAPDDTIKADINTSPCAIEIRVSKDKNIYRISNAFKNKDKFTYKQIKDLSNKLAKLEADKYMNRFLHGSWSVGNITTNANLLDFDTATFVKGRCPQYSNTNKYKSNYFGFEIEGSKNIIKLLFDNALKENNYKYEELEKEMYDKYNEYLLIDFCKIIGLDYKKDYEKNNKLIDKLFNKFMFMSKQFIPNYYDLNATEKNSNNTFIYDFSNFFQNFLIGRNNDLLYGINLLINDTVKVSYEKVGFIKDKVDELFSEYIIEDSEDSNILKEAIEFINLYKELFDSIDNLNNIRFKQYILNKNRSYIYNSDEIYGVLSHLYSIKKIDNYTFNIIINNLITTNTRTLNKKEYCCNLNIKEKYLTYMVISKNYYYYVLIPYHKTIIRFAKLCLHDEEYMFHHVDNILVSDKINYKDLNEININPKILTNGKKDQTSKYKEYIDYDKEKNDIFTTIGLNRYNIDDVFIKEVLNDYYDIEIIKVDKTDNESTYCIHTNDRKYNLKIYENNTIIENTIRRNNKNIIKTINNKLAVLREGLIIVLEEYNKKNNDK